MEFHKIFKPMKGKNIFNNNHITLFIINIFFIENNKNEHHWNVNCSHCS